MSLFSRWLATFVIAFSLSAVAATAQARSRPLTAERSLQEEGQEGEAQGQGADDRPEGDAREGRQGQGQGPARRQGPARHHRHLLRHLQPPRQVEEGQARPERQACGPAAARTDRAKGRRDLLGPEAGRQGQVRQEQGQEQAQHGPSEGRLPPGPVDLSRGTSCEFIAQPKEGGARRLSRATSTRCLTRTAPPASGSTSAPAACRRTGSASRSAGAVLGC